MSWAYREPELQRFVNWSGVLTSISGRQRSAIGGLPLAERTDFSLQSATWHTHAAASRNVLRQRLTILV